MPVFKQGRHGPAWGCLEQFEIVEVPKEGGCAFGRISPKEKIIILEGGCLLDMDGVTHRAGTGDVFSLTTPDARLSVTADEEAVRLVRLCGHWKFDDNPCGIFNPAKRSPAREPGDPYRYPKTNDMDNHYHDFDEFWVICRGRGLVVTEGNIVEVKEGDCVATGMGHHHDFPVSYEPVMAVFLEGDPEGGKRPGHLWEHAHGKAMLKKDRI